MNKKYKVGGLIATILALFVGGMVYDNSMDISIQAVPSAFTVVYPTAGSYANSTVVNVNWTNASTDSPNYIVNYSIFVHTGQNILVESFGANTTIASNESIDFESIQAGTYKLVVTACNNASECTNSTVDPLYLSYVETAPANVVSLSSMGGGYLYNGSITETVEYLNFLSIRNDDVVSIVGYTQNNTNDLRLIVAYRDFA